MVYCEKKKFGKKTSSNKITFLQEAQQLKSKTKELMKHIERLKAFSALNVTHLPNGSNLNKRVKRYYHCSNKKKDDLTRILPEEKHYIGEIIVHTNEELT